MTETITGLTEEDGQTIGFVVSCWYNDVIELAELRKWCEHVIITNEMRDIPHYTFDLMNVDSPGGILDIIGFLPDELSRQEDRALYGIAFGRGRDVFDPPLSRTAAQRALQARPDVLQRFRDVFPFRAGRAASRCDLKVHGPRSSRAAQLAERPQLPNTG